MSLLKHLGKKQMEIATKWVGSATSFGTGAGLLVVYMTDWKTVLQYLPFYNGKYDQ